jgi:hypothetical protein
MNASGISPFPFAGIAGRAAERISDSRTRTYSEARRWRDQPHSNRPTSLKVYALSTSRQTRSLSPTSTTSAELAQESTT